MAIITRYAVLVLFIIASGLGVGLYNIVKASGVTEQQLEETQDELAAAHVHMGSLTTAYKQQMEEIDHALQQSEKRRREAEKQAQEAGNALAAIPVTDGFDTNFSRNVIDGLSTAALAYMPTTCSLQDDTDGIDGADPFTPITCRDITTYTVRLASSLQECNGRLEAIRDVM